MSSAQATPGDYARFSRHEADEDARFSSGAPVPKTKADLDFIRMTGMTTPALIHHHDTSSTEAPSEISNSSAAKPAEPSPSVPSTSPPWQGQSQAALGFQEIIESLKPKK